MRVLLATDGSSTAIEATRTVAELGRDNSLDVTVLMVSYDPRSSTMQPWAPEWVEHENERVHSILADAKRILDNSCRTVTLVHAAGTTVPMILKESKKVRADLIVVGARGHSAIRRLLLGSVSDSIASRAQCSVLVIRPSHNPRFQRIVPPFQRIVLGYDKSMASREAAAELLDIQIDRQVNIDVVSVVQEPFPYVGEGYIGPPIMIQPEQIDAITETNERIACTISDLFPQTRSVVSISEHVGDAIVQNAIESKADVVIVGDTGHSAVGELLLGSTSKYVLRHAPCSVWISRHHWKSADPTFLLHSSAASSPSE